MRSARDLAHFYFLRQCVEFGGSAHIAHFRQFAIIYAHLRAYNTMLNIHNYCTKKLILHTLLPPEDPPSTHYLELSELFGIKYEVLCTISIETALFY